MPLAGVPVIRHLIDRMALVLNVDAIVVATTTNPADDPLEDYVMSIGFVHGILPRVYRGSEEDCLGRNYEAARELKADIVVLTGADDVLTDPVLTAGVIDAVEAGAVYSESRHMPLGTGVRAVTLAALAEAASEATLPLEREHVTGYLDKRPSIYPVVPVFYGGKGSPDLYPVHRLTIDTPADLELHQRIFDTLYPSNPKFTLDDVLALLAEHPDWEALVLDTPHLVPDRTPVDGTAWRPSRYGNIPVKYDE